jgi:PAS domain S-box-containing protein
MVESASKDRPSSQTTPAAAPREPLPRKARLVIWVAVLAASAIMLARMREAFHWSGRDLLAWAAITVATALIEQISVSLQHRTEAENFSVTDALWVAALIVARPSVLALAAPAGIVIGQAGRRWAPVKIAYNAAQYVLALTLAQAIVGVFEPLRIGPQAWLAVGLGMLGYFAVNEGMIALIIAIIEGESFRRVFVLPAALNVMNWAGNVTIGMLGALVWWARPDAVPLLAAPILLSYFASRAWLQGREERERARDQERMRMLYEAGRRLFGPLDDEPDLRPFLAQVSEMVGARAAELVLCGDSGITVQSSDGTKSSRALRPEERVEAILRSERDGFGEGHIVPVDASDESRGLLAVYRDEPLSEAERALLSALCSQLEVKLDNHRLFLEAVEQRAQVAQQRAQLAEIVANTSDGIAVVAADGTVISWNPAMWRITGFPPKDVEGRTLDAALPAKLGEGEDRSLIDVLAAAEEPVDVLVARADGIERWLRCTGSPIPGPSGGVKGRVVVVRDVTTERETEQLKQSFVGMVSHELRTPLTPLKGFLMSLANGLIDDSPDVRHEYYEIMLRQASRLEQLINDLLDVSRIDAGTVGLEERLVDLSTLLLEQVGEFTSPEQVQRVHFAGPDEPVTAMVDPLRVGQVFTNLLSNALKYSPPDSPVDVTVQATSQDAVVSVRDRGPGLAGEDQLRVFEPFHRVDNSLTRTTGGTGLGLYIARRMVEAMGGRVWVESQLGDGACFSFSLPLDARRTALERPSTLISPATGGR